MIINRINVENFGSIKSATFHPQKGIVGIFGESDNNAEKSNGSGKSTLVEAIPFGLFGRSQKGTISDLSSTFSTDPLVVDVTFSLLDKRFRVRRTWSEKSGGFLQLWESDIEFAGAIREVQERIDDLFSLSYPVLTATSFFLQGSSDSFSAATSSERLSYMREILSLTFWDDCYNIALREKKVASAELLQTKATVDSINQSLLQKRESFSIGELTAFNESKSALEVNLKAIREKQKKLREEKEVAYKSVLERDSLNEKVESLIADLDLLVDSQKIFESKKVVDSSVKAYRSVEHFLQETREELVKKNLRLGELTADMKRETDFLSVSPKAGVVCPTCRQKVAAKDASVHMEEAREKWAELTEETDTLKKEIGRVSTDIGIYGDFIYENKKAVDYLINRLIYIKEMEESELVKENIITAKLLIASANQQLEDLKESAQLAESFDPQLFKLEQDASKNESSLREVSDKVVELMLIEKQIGELSTDLLVKEGSLRIVTEKESTFDTLQRLFGRTGVSFYVVKKVVKSFLEKNCNQILEKLSSYRVEFNLKTSSDKNTLDILIHTGDGVRKYETFSGGERELLNFAIRMSLSQLLKRRGVGSSIQFVVLDEIFGYLDDYNKSVLEQVLMLLRKEFSQLFVISHIPLDLSFDQFVTIKKVGSCSILE